MVLLPPQLPQLTPTQAIALAMQLYEAALFALRHREENSAMRQDWDGAATEEG